MAGLVRWGWDPFKDMEREMQDLTDRFSRVMTRWPERGAATREALMTSDWMPTVDISETEAEYLVKAEIPEVDRKDVKVMLQDHVLTIRGERRQESEDKGKRFHRIERSYGTFLRTFDIPDRVDEDKLKAAFRDGMLTIHLPKSEQAKSKAVEVNVE